MTITSANSYCGYNICHSQKYYSNVVFIFHKQTKSGYYICHKAKKHQAWHNHMANNICQQHLMVVNQMWQQHQSHPTSKKSWPKICKKHKLWQTYQFLAKTPTKIINNNIPHTPTEAKCKEEDRRDNPTMTPTYEMAHQEIWLQHKEEKYGIYMSTFCYEGDDSNLDSEMDNDSNVTAYPFLE